MTSFDISGFVRSSDFSAQAAVKADKNTDEILDSYRTNTQYGTNRVGDTDPHEENELEEMRREPIAVMHSFQQIRYAKTDAQTHEIDGLRMSETKTYRVNIHEMRRETGQAQAQRQRQTGLTQIGKNNRQ